MQKCSIPHIKLHSTFSWSSMDCFAGHLLTQPFLHAGFLSTSPCIPNPPYLSMTLSCKYLSTVRSKALDSVMRKVIRWGVEYKTGRLDCNTGRATGWALCTFQVTTFQGRCDWTGVGHCQYWNIIAIVSWRCFLWMGKAECRFDQGIESYDSPE